MVRQSVETAPESDTLAGRRAYRIARTTDIVRWKPRGAGLLVKAAKEQDSPQYATMRGFHRNFGNVRYSTKLAIGGPDDWDAGEGLPHSPEMIDTATVRRRI
jgi:hypothetical protein